MLDYSTTIGRRGIYAAGLAEGDYCCLLVAMPKRYWHHPLATAALALVVLGAVIASFFGYLEQAQRIACDQAFQTCVPDHNDEPYNGWRDTNAQWFMAVFGLLGIGVGGWTIVLLQQTISATKRGNKDARKASRRQLRAYVLVDDVEIDGKGYGTTFIVLAKNSGQSPALAFRYAIGVFDIQPTADAVVDRSKPFSMFDMGAGSTRPLNASVPELAGKMLDDVLNGRLDLWLHGVIEYEDVFGLPHSTWFKQHIWGEKGQDGKFAMHVAPTGDGNHST